MSVLKKVVNFFTEEETEEKEVLKKELMEERKKYVKKEEPKLDIEENPIIQEPVKKQVLFMDETFEKKDRKIESSKQPVKYNDVEDRKFKPTSYISPVHGLIKSAEDVPEYNHESKTKSESDYVKIRKKVFGNEVFEDELGNEKTTVEPKVIKSSEVTETEETNQVLNEDDMKIFKTGEFEFSEKERQFKIFETKEIVDLKKRLQVDENGVEQDITLDEAYDSDSDIDAKTVVNNEESTGYLFDLLDELGDGEESE